MGMKRLVRLIEDDPVKDHQIKVAIQTLKMPGPMARVMGQSKEKAIKVLKDAGWSDDQIAKVGV